MLLFRLLKNPTVRRLLIWIAPFVFRQLKKRFERRRAVKRQSISRNTAR